MPPPIRVVRSLLPAFHAETSQRRGGLYSRWIPIDLRRELIYRVLSWRPRPKLNPPFYQSSVRSCLDLFNQSSLDPSCQSSAQSCPSVEAPSLFHQSCFESSLRLFCQSSLESGANNPFNHYSLRPLSLFIQSCVQSRPSLESLDLFNQSRLESLNPSTLPSLKPLNLSYQSSLDLFNLSSLKRRASSRPSNGGISRASTPP